MAGSTSPDIGLSAGRVSLRHEIHAVPFAPRRFVMIAMVLILSALCLLVSTGSNRPAE